jgi:hypothetical protein
VPEAALADGFTQESRYRPLCSFGGGALSCLGGAACLCGGGALWVSLGALGLGALSRGAGFGALALGALSLGAGLGALALGALSLAFGAGLGLAAACGWAAGRADSVRGAFVACEAGAGEALAA